MSLITDVLTPLQSEAQRQVSPKEFKLLQEIFSAFAALFDCVGLEDSPIIALRVQEIIVSLLVLAQFERTMWAEGVLQEKEPNGWQVNPLVEQSAKTRERMRKAMKELEDHSAKVGKDLNEGLPDRFRELMKRAEGVIEAALKEKDEAAASDATR